MFADWSRSVEHLDFDFVDVVGGDAELFGHAFAEIDDPSGDEGTAIVDATDGGCAVAENFYLDACAEGQLAMGAGSFVGIVRLAARGFSVGEGVRVKRGDAFERGW